MIENCHIQDSSISYFVFYFQNDLLFMNEKSILQWTKNDVSIIIFQFK